MMESFALAIGVFVGNWLIAPLIFKRTFKDGFWIGLLAAMFTLMIMLVFTALTK